MLLLQRGAVVLVVALGGLPLAAQSGLVLHQGQWLRRYDVEKLEYADYMRAHGYVHYFGRWRRQAEVRKIQQLTRHPMNRLSSPREETRDHARDRLHDIARDHDMPRLALLADRVHRDYGEYWRHERLLAERRRHTVTMGINFQHTELLGLETVPVSLGVGAPVRIQLPRIRTVSIGTTVTVPASIGR